MQNISGLPQGLAGRPAAGCLPLNVLDQDSTWRWGRGETAQTTRDYPRPARSIFRNALNFCRSAIAALVSGFGNINWARNGWGAHVKNRGGVNWFTHPTRGEPLQTSTRNARGGSDVRFGCPSPPRLFVSHFDPLQGHLLVLLVGPGTRCGAHSDARARGNELGVVPRRMRCPPLSSTGRTAFVFAEGILHRGLASHRPQHSKRHNRRNDVEDRSDHKNCRPTTGPGRQHVPQRN
jgi:hypothetical protein